MIYEAKMWFQLYNGILLDNIKMDAVFPNDLLCDAAQMKFKSMVTKGTINPKSNALWFYLCDTCRTIKSIQIKIKFLVAHS